MTDRWYDKHLYDRLCDTDKLRIVHVCKGFPPERGGMETFARDLAVEQAHAGHQVTVLAHSNAPVGNDDQPDWPGGLHVIRCPAWFQVGPYVPVAPRLPIALGKILLAAPPHIVHLHAPNSAALWCLLLTALCCRAQQAAPKLVVHWHADVIFPPHKRPATVIMQAWRMLEQRLLARADRVIVTSQPYLETSQALAPWKSKCVVVPLRLSERTRPVPASLPHPVTDFLRGPVPGTTRSVLAVGRLSHYKGFDVLLKAVAQAPELRCCIIGTGEEESSLHALIREFHLEDRVMLPGPVNDDVLAACYQACDVFCLPSILRTEAFGLVLLEALRAGKWCIASDVHGSGMGTVIQHGVNGWLVAPGAVDALCAKLQLIPPTHRQPPRADVPGRECSACGL